MSRTFEEFRTLCEATYDPDVAGRSQIRKQGEGGRLYPSKKKTKPEIRRKKAVGGGKTEPVEYKDRKDIGQQKQRSEREQQPEKERGSAALSPKEAQRKAYRERKARERGEKTKSAKELLTKSKKKTVDPKYKQAKASGYTRAERMKVTRKGETELRGIMKKQETDKYKKETGQNPDKKGKQKILGRVHKRMSN